jgi:hypothetical protein
MMISSSIPEVYVLWHPRCEVGETVARRIYEWLRPGNGLGPQVFYRCLPAPGAPPGGLPPPLPGENRSSQDRRSARSGNLQVVLPLIDENMIADPTWRFWLSQLAAPSGTPRRMFPVALDTTAFNAPAPVRGLNFLRPTGVLKPGLDVGDKALRSLLKQLTEVLCRVLLTDAGQGDGTSGAPKIKIFLSHAKQDGTTAARRIRDYIYSQTQIAAFYDENDIPLGSAFARVLEADLGANQTAALIAVRSARYASRPWCRRELSLFRTPRREAPGSCFWQLSPVLVVDAIEPGASTQGLPELGNAPIIRWADGTVEDQEAHIVTIVLRDAMLGAVHAAIGKRIPEAASAIVINWLPDPTSLIRVLQAYPAGQTHQLHYPGRGLSGLELDILDELFPNLELHSFEEFLQ